MLKNKIEIHDILPELTWIGLKLSTAVTKLEEGEIKEELLRHLEDCVLWEKNQALSKIEQALICIHRILTICALPDEIGYWVKRLTRAKHGLLLALQ